MSMETHVTERGVFVIAHGELDDADIAVLRSRCGRGVRLELDLRDVPSVHAVHREALGQLAADCELHVFGLSPSAAAQ